MAISDKTLTCVDCGYEFTFTVGEQEFFASRGYTNEPKRCTQPAEIWRIWWGRSRDASRRLRPVRQGHHGSFPAPWRQTGVLQRLLQRNEVH